MRYKVEVTEFQASQQTGTAVDQVIIFGTIVDFKPNLAKLIAALTPPRIRKPRSAKA